MSQYLQFFQLEQSPFEGHSQSQVVLGTRALRDAFARISSGLDEGASRICVSGGAGLGKTSLARALPKLLGETARVALVSDPSVPWESLRGPIGKQWGLAGGGLARARLVEAADERRLVLVIDQAERASEEFLDHLDVVLSYRSEQDQPVVQTVLLARLSGSDLAGTDPAPLVWWLDRIQTLQLEFAPLPRDGVDSYIQKHLKRAGRGGGRIFSQDAALAIHEYTSGIPGEVSSLCERLLAEAAFCDVREIDEGFVRSICDEAATTGSGDMPWSFDDELDDFEESEELLLDQPVPGQAHLEEDSSLDAEPEARPAEGRPPAHPAAGAGAPLTDALVRLQQAEGGANAETASSQALHGSLDAASDVRRSPADAETTNPAIAMLERALSSAVTAEELRAIRGTLLARHARTIAAGAVAVLIAGIAFAFFVGGDEAATPGQALAGPNADQLSQTPLARAPRPSGAADPLAGRAMSANAGEAGPVLARLRGPVTKDAPAGSRPAGSAIAPSPAPQKTPGSVRPPGAKAPRTSLQALADGSGPLSRVTRDGAPPASMIGADLVGEEEDPSELDIDARPPGLPAAPGVDPVAQEKFW